MRNRPSLSMSAIVIGIYLFALYGAAGPIVTVKLLPAQSPAQAAVRATATTRPLTTPTTAPALQVADVANLSP